MFIWWLQRHKCYVVNTLTLRDPSPDPFTDGPHTDTCPYLLSPMVSNTYALKHFHSWSQTLPDTHPQTPFTHGSDTDTCSYPLGDGTRGWGQGYG